MGRADQSDLFKLAGTLSVLVVGLTGGIGSGKTAVSDQFARLGAPVIDTDQISRELVEPGQPALAEIVATFGPDCLDERGRLRRDRLRERVFADPDGRRRLEAILHPRVRAAMHGRIARLHAPYCVVVIPLLVETGMTEGMDRILVVDVPESEQIRRVMARDGASEQQARQILAAQARREKRLSHADDVLENTGDLEALNERVAALHERYLALAKAKL